MEPSTAAYTSAANSTFTTAYDAAGNPVTVTEPGGVTVTNTYNNVSELTGQSGDRADAATPTRTFGYDTGREHDVGGHVEHRWAAARTRPASRSPTTTAARC